MSYGGKPATYALGGSAATADYPHREAHA